MRNENCLIDYELSDKFVIITHTLNTYPILYNRKTTIYANKVEQPFTWVEVAGQRSWSHL